MGSGTLRPRGDLTTLSSTVSFTAFGFGLQYCGCEAERILPLQLFFYFQEGEMPNQTVGARTEMKTLQSVYDRDLLGTNIAPISLDSSVAAWAEAKWILRDGPFAFLLKPSLCKLSFPLIKCRQSRRSKSFKSQGNKTLVHDKLTRGRVLRVHLEVEGSSTTPVPRVQHPPPIDVPSTQVPSDKEETESVADSQKDFIPLGRRIRRLKRGHISSNEDSEVNFRHKKTSVEPLYCDMDMAYPLDDTFFYDVPAISQLVLMNEGEVVHHVPTMSELVPFNHLPIEGENDTLHPISGSGASLREELKREQEQLELRLHQLNESLSEGDVQLSYHRREITRLREDKIVVEGAPVLSAANAKTLDTLRVSFKRLRNGFKDLSWE
ncbi:hypothetical protein GBA52_014953 [Prunus armeniaca]|nr:hypothetical protein GBA52_014953 [Prunus armeniaca]